MVPNRISPKREVMPTAYQLPREDKPVARLPVFAALILDEHGIIGDCSDGCETEFGYTKAELQGKHVSRLLPRFEGVELLSDGQINPRLRYICHCAIPFLANRRDGSSFHGQVSINYLNSETSSVQIIVRKLDSAVPR